MTALSGKGATFARMAIATAIGKGFVANAAEIANARWGEGSQPARLLKAAVSAGSTDDANWAGPLAGEVRSAAAEFMAAVRQQSIVGRLAGLRRLPPRVPILLQTGKATGAWVKQGEPMPVSRMAFRRSTLETMKVAALCVVTEELLRSAEPGAEDVIRADLVRAVAEASDLAFIDPTNAGAEDVTPASVTHGVDPLAIGASLSASITQLVANFTGDLQAAYFVGAPELFASMAGADYPNIGARGGEIVGIPALASAQAPRGAGDSYMLTLIDPTGIAYTADDEAAQIKTSTQGSIEMSDTPDGDGAEMVSLWQLNLVAIAALLHENWRVEREGSVAMITGIALPTEA